MRKFLLLFLAVFIFPLAAHAADPYFAFEKSGPRGVSAAFQSWHPEFEDNGDYGESWFFYVQTDDGGALFAMISITNLGLRTFGTTCDINYYSPDGKVYNYHKEHDRTAITASTAKMDVKVGSARVWGGGSEYHFTVDDSELKMNFTLHNLLPSYKFGNGSVKFFEDRSSEWTLGINTPTTKSTGSITIGGKTFNLKGYGYHDHGWATIKLPSFVRKWYTFRALDDKFSLVLHHQYLNSNFGKENIRFGLLGMNGKIAAASRNFLYTPQKWRSESGFKIPTELEITMNAGGYKVHGTVTEKRFLAAVDVLGQISWPIRMAIKAFYTNPYLIRYLGQYEIDITDKDGNVEHFSGVGLIEANYY
jgi:Svf1-like protein